MKPFLAIFFSLLFGLFFPVLVFAQEDLVITVSPTPTVHEIVYDMPYPGLLPDNPLYIFKVARDRLIGFLISDPLKKATFDLLQSDKRFQAGLMLYEKDPQKKQLAFDTISKGQNYVEDAISKVGEAKKQNMTTSDIVGKLNLSLRKQQQILTELEESHPDVTKEVTQASSRLTDLQQKVEQLRLKSK